MNRKMIAAAVIALVVCLIVVSVVRKNKTHSPILEVRIKAESMYNTAASLEKDKKIDEAVKLYRELVEQFPQQKVSADAWYRLGEFYEAQGIWDKVQEAYSEILAEFPDFKQISEVEQRLWTANINILFSPIVTGKAAIYKVEPGDTLGAIARKHQTTVELIKRSNNLQSDLIRPGKRLKVTTAKYSIIVDKSQNSLILKADDEIFKVYSVATGKFDGTPVGNYTIVEKLVNPDWYRGGVGVIPAQSPENILGTRWLGLSEPEYGIHGGAQDNDLGKQLTAGCVRMVNRDVEELFAIVPRGTEVAIVE